MLYNANIPLDPTYISGKTFVCYSCPALPPGDYDWVQFNVSVCDDCRYGVSHFWAAGMALFDLGTGTAPAIQTGAHYYEASSDTQGAFTFKHNNQQYMIVNNLIGANDEDFPAPNTNCDLNTLPTLFMVNGTGPEDLTDIGCVDANGAGMSVLNGLYLSSGSNSYIYLIDRATFRVHIFRLSGSGSGLTLQYMGAPLFGYSKFGRGIRADEAAQLLVTANNATPSAQLWDISDPGQPMELARFDAFLKDDRGLATKVMRADVKYPIAVFAKNVGQPIFTFDISDLTSPKPLDQTFWDAENTWNSEASYPYLANTDTQFSRDGTALYLSRYSVLEVINAGQCGPDLPPTANLNVDPAPAFPGDLVTVTNTSAGIIATKAVWITDLNGTIVAGSDQLSAVTADTLQFTVPIDVATDQVYTAHVAVANTENPYLASVPGDQLKEQVVQINRAPQAKIATNPVAAITGAQITLTATDTEGNPLDPSGANAYQWQIMPPTAQSFSLQGVEVPVTLSESGDWTFWLTVQYSHSEATGGLYQSIVSTVRSYSSVAADFTVYSTSGKLCSDESIILDASSSQYQAGAELAYSWLFGGQTTACVSTSYKCTLPANFKNPGTYDVQLTLANQATSPQDTSVMSKSVKVVDCSFSPAINASDSTPDIGQPVMFTLAGVPEDVEKVSWNFGAPGCEDPQTSECINDGVGFGCNQKTHKYASAGSKNVTAKVFYEGAWFNSDPLVVTVKNEGSCGNEPCTFNLSPSSRSFSKGTGSGSFTVSASKDSCTWAASTTASWIQISSGSGRGNGTVQYTVKANTGQDRSGSIRVGSSSHSVDQAGSAGAVDFTISNSNPKIGETITLSLAGGTPVRWEMGGASCDSDDTARVCSGIGLCNLTVWEYRSAGSKTITLVAEEGSKSKTITVQSIGQCSGACERDGKPTASFQISPTPAIVNEPVTFTDTSSKLLLLPEEAADEPADEKTLGVLLSFSPDVPDIGQNVWFQIEGAPGSVDSASWNFGEPGCAEYPQNPTCTYDGGIGFDCATKKHKFSSGGDKSVSVSIVSSGKTYNIGPITVPISNSGSCGGTTCTYTISRSSQSFSSAQGTGSVGVTATAGCAWTAASRSGWITVLSGASGNGSGTVQFRVAANTGAARTGSMLIAGKTFTVMQDAGAGSSGGGTAPDEWLWVVSKDGQSVLTRTTQSFSYSFTQPGTYSVRLTVGNCRGSTTETKTFEVTEFVEPDDHVVPAAAHTVGSYNTLWLSDLKLFNPGDSRVSIDLKFLPENQASPITPGFKINLDPRETAIYDDVLNWVPGIGGDNIKGGLLLVYNDGDGRMPTIMSKTFNSTASGTYGQTVPALPILAKKGNYIYLAGLRQNQDYRTNLGLANAADRFASGIRVTILDPEGNVLGEPYEFGIRKRNTIQLANLPGYCDIEGDLDLFTVEVDTGGNDVVAIASVVSMASGDPWTLYPGHFGDKKVIIPGVAHIPGFNDSEWRTDLTLFNPTESEITARVDYIPEQDLGYEPYFDITLSPKMTWGAVDILYSVLRLGSEETTKGYLVISGYDESSAPQIAARTYNQTVDSGTYGQGIPGFGESSFLQEGESGYFAGLCNIVSKAEGFRTNVGMVNISQGSQTKIDVSLYNKNGTNVAFKRFVLEPGEFRQINLFNEMGLGETDIDASAIFKVVEGGPAAAYSSIIDLITSDPIYVEISK